MSVEAHDQVETVSIGLQADASRSDGEEWEIDVLCFGTGNAKENMDVILDIFWRT